MRERINERLRCYFSGGRIDQGVGVKAPVERKAGGRAKTASSPFAFMLHPVVQLPHLAEGAIELHNAHANRLNIRGSLARPDFQPR
jgi:hypothetical protein